MYENSVRLEENKEAIILSFTATGIVGAIPIVMSNFLLSLLIIPPFAFAFGIYISNRYSGIGSSLGVSLVYVFNLYTGNMLQGLASISISWKDLTFWNFLVLFFAVGVTGYFGGLYRESKEEFQDKIVLGVMILISLLIVVYVAISI